MEMVKNEYGYEFDLDAAAALMDDETRETVHGEFAPCDPQTFFDAYCKAHYEKFGEDFELAKKNPVW